MVSGLHHLQLGTREKKAEQQPRRFTRKDVRGKVIKLSPVPSLCHLSNFLAPYRFTGPSPSWHSTNVAFL